MPGKNGYITLESKKKRRISASAGVGWKEKQMYKPIYHTKYTHLSTYRTVDTDRNTLDTHTYLVCTTSIPNGRAFSVIVITFDFLSVCSILSNCNAREREVAKSG